MVLSRALSILIASGVLLAGAVLWSLTRNSPIRAIVGVLTAYGAAAFVHAAAIGLTVRALLAGGGLFSALPRVLQGAFIGAVIVLPLGWTASVLRAGITRFRQGSGRRAAYQSVALTLILALVIGSLPRWSPAQGRTEHAARGIQVTALANSLRAIADGDRRAPRDRWDPAYVVQTVGTQPEALFEWVRANTRWVPYRGRLRGAVGVLMDRDGNSLDRSILVGTLLRSAGHSVRLAHAQLTPSMAADLVELMTAGPGAHDLVASSRSGTPSGDNAIPDGSIAVRTLAARYQLDETSVTRDIALAERGLDRFRTDLNRRVADQTARLLATVVRPNAIDESKRRRALATSALVDHWWVQLQRGGQWIDCDLLAGGRMGRSLTAATNSMPLDGIPPELNHAVVVRLVAEYESRGMRSEENVLEYEVTPADAPARGYLLQLWPTAWPSQIAHTSDGRFGIKAAALEQQQWAAILSVDGGDPVAHGLIRDALPPAHSNAFTGFADAFSSSQRATAPHDGGLTAVWIEYELRAPGRDRQVSRRAVFDLRAARGTETPLTATDLTENERLARSLALMMQTEILIVGWHLAPEWVAHLSSESAASTEPLLHALASADGPLEREQLMKPVAAARRPATPLHLLAMSRVGWAADDDPAVIESLNVLTRHRYPRLGQSDVQLVSAFDIVINDVAVALNLDDEFAARLRQGVVDTNLEALLSGDRGAPNTADAYAQQRDWVVITPADRSTLERLPLRSDSRLAIVHDLDRGYVVVAARTTAGASSPESVGWWRIHASTGDTLGLGANGWGMGPEDSALFNMAVAAARGFTFEYGLCQGFPAGINLLRYLNDSYFDSWHPHWTTYNRSKSAAEVFDDSNVRCLIGAIAMGVVATLPILLMTLNAKNMRTALRLAEEVAAEEKLAKELEAHENDLMKLPGIEGPMPLQVRTQVWRDAGYTDTLVPGASPGWTRDPVLKAARESSISAAKGAMQSAQKELNTSMREYLEYLNGRKPPQYGGRLLDPSYDPEVLEALRARAELDFDRYAEKVDDLLKLDPLERGGWGGGGGGAPPPPQPIGNNNITQDAQVVGAAGAKGAVGK